MSTLDLSIIALYFIIMIAMGVWYTRRASRNLDSYFLGDKGMHWVMLSASGAVSTFDITGTMWIVSMFYVLGMKSLWIHWMWGWMMGAFFLAYMGKWVRRSGVMTGAEWMLTRFGSGTPGRVARTAYALVAVITLAGFIGYDFEGIGKFAAVYIPWDPDTLAFLIIGVTTLYAMFGGLYGVVATDVAQTVILTVAGIVIIIVAYLALTPQALATHLPADWLSLAPAWKIPEFADTKDAPYMMFGPLVIVWVLKGLLLNAGGPAQMYDFQRFLAARDARDACKLGAAWSLFLIIRWGMTIGITLIGLTVLSGVTDAETVMPAVLKGFLPMGLRGLVIAGLLAAFMSTFSSTVNVAASYVVRDLCQTTFLRDAGPRALIKASYVATLAVVGVGFMFGLWAKSIAQIWTWLMMALGAGFLIPNLLRWYWWRMNGWGYTAGTLAGILLSLITFFYPDMPIYVYFPWICLVSLAATIIGSYATPPVDRETLIKFYRTVRPFGVWGPIRREAALPPETARDPRESASIALFNTVVAMIGITAIYLFPMYLVGHWHGRAALAFAVALAAGVVLWRTWYRNLPAEEEGAG